MVSFLHTLAGGLLLLLSYCGAARLADNTRQRATAPFAQCDNLPAEAYPAPASFQLRKKQGSAVARVRVLAQCTLLFTCCWPAGQLNSILFCHDCLQGLLPPAQVGGHGEGFNPDIYAANRMANAQTREESRAKMSIGSGNILAHTVQGACVAPRQPGGSVPEH